MKQILSSFHTRFLSLRQIFAENFKILWRHLCRQHQRVKTTILSATSKVFSQYVQKLLIYSKTSTHYLSFDGKSKLFRQKFQKLLNFEISFEICRFFLKYAWRHHRPNFFLMKIKNFYVSRHPCKIWAYSDGYYGK